MTTQYDQSAPTFFKKYSSEFETENVTVKKYSDRIVTKGRNVQTFWYKEMKNVIDNEKEYSFDYCGVKVSIKLS